MDNRTDYGDTMLEQEFEYFKDHQDELVEKHPGKYVVIQGEQVIGVYDTEAEAYARSREQHALGTFLIQECTPGKDAYSQTFHSRAIFA